VGKPQGFSHRIVDATVYDRIEAQAFVSYRSFSFNPAFK